MTHQYGECVIFDKPNRRKTKTMLLTHIVFSLQQKKFRRGSIELSRIRCVEIVKNGGGIIPCQNKYPFQVPRHVQPRSLWRTSLVSKLSLSPLSDCPGGVWYQHSVRLRSEPRQQECLGPEHEGGSVSHLSFITVRAACTDLLLFLKEINLRYCTSSATESWVYDWAYRLCCCKAVFTH